MWANKYKNCGMNLSKVFKQYRYCPNCLTEGLKQGYRPDLVPSGLRTPDAALSGLIAFILVTAFVSSKLNSFAQGVGFGIIAGIGIFLW